MNNRTHRLFMILIFFMTLLSVFSTSVVDAYIPPAQSGTQSFSGSNFSYATIGYTVSLNRNTTSISIHDDGFLRADTTASAVYTHEPKTIVNSSTRERYIRGSVYTRQYDGTYRYFNINIRLNPANFSSSNLVKGRSLLDNLYLEPATNIDTLNGLLSSERTGFLNPIYVVGTEAERKNSNWPNTHRLKPKYLWGDSPSDKYAKRTSVYTTRRVYQSLVWTPHTTGTMSDAFEKQVPFPIVDDFPPVLKSWDVQGSGLYKEGSNTFWTKPGNKITAIVEQSDTGVGNKTQHFRTYKWPYDKITTRDYHDFFRADTSFGSQITSSDLVVNSAKRTSNTKASGKVEWDFTPIVANSTFRIETHMRDNFDNNSGYEIFAYVKTDNNPPEEKGVMIDANVIHQDGDTYWVKPGTRTSVEIAQKDARSGDRFQYLRILKGNEDIRARHEIAGNTTNKYNVSTFSQSNSNMSIDSVSRTVKNDVYYVKWMVTPIQANQTFNIQYHLADNVGNTLDYKDNGVNIKTDSVKPSRVKETITNYNGKSGNTYWIKPGSTANVVLKGSDSGSGLRDTRLSVGGGSNRLLSQHVMSGSSDNHSTSSTLTGMELIKVSRNTNNEVVYEMKGLDHGSRHLIRSYFSDNVQNISDGDIYGWGNLSDTFYLGVDGVGPTISASEDSRDWTNTSNSVNVSLSDADSGVKDYRFYQSGSATLNRSMLDSSSWVTGDSFTFGRPGPISSYYTFIEARDHAGNISYKRFGPYRYDGTAPTATMSGNPTEWTNQNPTLKLNITDGGGSGYSHTKLPNGVTSTSTTPGYMVSRNGDYTFTVYDNAGNSRNISIQVTKIDKSLPSLTLTQSPGGWTNGSVIIMASASDTGGSGVKGIRRPNGTWSDGSGDSQVVTSNGTYEFTVEDNAGNTRTVSQNVTNIDKSNPNGTVTQNINGWTNGNVILTFNASDTGVSGVKQVRQEGGTWVSGSLTTRTVTSNGTYSFEVEDHAGNKRTISHTVTNIDKANPTGTVTPNITAWTNQNVVLTFNATDTGGSGVRRVRQTGGSWVSGSSTTRTVTSNGTYSFEVEDNAGNQTIKSIEIDNIDKALPTGSISKSTTSWTSDPVELTLTTNDTGGSGYSHTKLPDGTTTTDIKPVFDAPSNGTYEFEIYDHAGNMRRVSTSVSNIDTSQPDGVITGNPTTWTNQNFYLTFKAEDVGLSGLAYVILPDGRTTASGTMNYYVTQNGSYTFTVQNRAGNRKSVTAVVTKLDKETPSVSISGNTTEWTNKDITLKVNQSDTGGSGYYRTLLPNGNYTTDPNPTYNVSSNGTYSFTVYDRAGNSRRVTETVNRIDKVKPSLSVTGNVSDWINQSFNLRVNVSDTGGSGYKHTSLPGGSQTFSTSFDHQINENGSYTFTVYDNAGNETSQTIVVDKIDKEKPTVSISGNPTEWTNQDVALSLSINDTGGSGYYRTRLPDGSYVTQTSPTYTVTENGTYTFIVYDNAGNSRTIIAEVTKIDKVKPVVTVTQDVTSWTNQDVELTLNVSDNLSGFDYIQGSDASQGKYVSIDKTNNTGNFSKTLDYSEGNLSGTLDQEGSDKVISGVYTSYDEKYVDNQTTSNYDSGGYKGVLSSYQKTGTSYTYKTISGYGGGSYTWGDHATSNGVEYKSKPSKPSSIYYNSGGYSGYLSISTWAGTHPNSPAYHSSSGTWMYRSLEHYAYSGTVSKGTSYSYTRYRGTVVRPESDTRVWEQTYSGMIYKNGTPPAKTYSKVFNAEYNQDFTFEVYDKAGNKTIVTHSVNNIDKEPPSQSSIKVNQ